MKMKLGKHQAATLALLVGFGTLAAMNGNSLVHHNNDQLSPRIMMSRYTSQNHYNFTQKQQQVNNITSLPANTSESTNWAGYIDSPSSGSKSYTSVSGSWTVPTVKSNQKNAIAAQWIGLGGVSSQDLLQMGTTEEIQNGQPVASVFWEMLPAASTNVTTVPIGSKINASISQSSGTTWNINFSVTTPNGKTQTKTIPVTLNSSYAQGIGTSAEWISEDPSNQNGQLYPLANMGTVTYSSALVNGQPLNATGNQYQPVALVSGSGQVLVTPTEIGNNNPTFSTETVSTSSSSSYGYSFTSNGRGNKIHRITVRVQGGWWHQDRKSEFSFSWNL